MTARTQSLDRLQRAAAKGRPNIPMAALKSMT
jgi:hypothetical protein